MAVSKTRITDLNAEELPARTSSWAYVLPMVAFVALTAIEGSSPLSYPVTYALKITLVAALAFACRSAWKDLQLNARALLAGVLVGLVVLAEWILVTKFVPGSSYGSARAAFDPFAEIGNPALLAAFLSVRFFGLVLVVPLIEEIFWRSFLLRYLSGPKWQEMRLGDFSLQAFIFGAAGFAIAHPEWLAAVLCAVAYGLLLRATRSLFACFMAHAVTNLGLGIYVVAARDWSFW